MKELTMKQSHTPVRRQCRWQGPHRPDLRRARLEFERLEDRTVPSVSVIESFEGPDLSAYQTQLRFAPSAVLLPIAAHDGSQGLVKQDGYEWMIRNDAGTQVHQTDTVSVWVKLADVADGRAYLGFDAVNSGDVHSPLSASGTLAVVMSPSTNQLIIQKDAGGNGVASFNNIATVSQTYQANQWYRLEATWGAANVITGTLYDSDGTTVLSTVNGQTTAPFPSGGGIAIRAFGHDKYFDTVALDTGSTDTPAQRAAIGGGLDPGWMPGNPPPPVGNGPSGGPAPVPWLYTSVPGTGIEVQLAAFNQLQQAAIVNGVVGLAATNNSLITGTKQVGWGDPLETPLLAQYIFSQLPGQPTQLIGASSTKHFFSSAHTDSQHLNPGENDTYGSGLNTTQSLYTYGSELDPVTGTLHSPIDRIGTNGSLSADGMVNNGNRTFPTPIDLLLQVNVADLDPAQNPAGTRWFLMGNLFVGGEQDVTQASRWVEIVPHFNGTTFTFTYPSGSGGQLDFRTIPGLSNATGPQVVHTNLTGTFAAPVDHDHLIFNIPIAPASFTLDQYAFTDPNGNTVNAATITPSDGTNTQFDITFPAQTTNGTYTLTVGPNITDTDGNAMSAPFTGHFVINHVTPAVISTTLTGAVSGPVHTDRIVFNTAIDPNSFTLDQYALVDPNGNAVNVTNITATDSTNTRFDITFDQQSAPGTYNLTVGPNITNGFGDPMASAFTSNFTLANNLIVNGGFESGSFSGWTQSGNTGATGVDGGNVHSGHFAAYLGPVGSDGFIAQTFGTTAGSTYVLDYWLEHDGGSPSDFYAQINGTTVPGSRLDSPPAFGYTEYTFSFVATGATTELKFGFREDPTYFHLDDVSVVPANGPAPHGGGSGGQQTFTAPVEIVAAQGGLAGSPALTLSPATPAAVQASGQMEQAILVDHIFSDLGTKAGQATLPLELPGSSAEVDPFSLGRLDESLWSL
jgi:methionine-rich copper-binding protein CopC